MIIQIIDYVNDKTTIISYVFFAQFTKGFLNIRFYKNDEDKKKQTETHRSIEKKGKLINIYDDNDNKEFYKVF